MHSSLAHRCTIFLCHLDLEIYDDRHRHPNINITFALKSLFRHKQHLSFFPIGPTVSPLSTMIISDAEGACSLRLVHLPSKLGAVAAVVPPSMAVCFCTVAAVIVIVSVPIQSKIMK